MNWEYLRSRSFAGDVARVVSCYWAGLVLRCGFVLTNMGHAIVTYGHGIICGRKRV